MKRLERRRRAGFDFVQHGAFERAAETMRLKAQYGEDAFKKAPAKGPIGPMDDPNKIPLDPNKVPLGGKVSTCSAR